MSEAETVVTMTDPLSSSVNHHVLQQQQAQGRPWMVHLDSPRIFWLLVAIFGPTLIWKPLRGIINKWRLQKRREKYPHIVVLEKTSKPKPAATKRSVLFSSKNALAVLQHWILPTLQGLLSFVFFLLVQPAIFVAFFLVARLRDSVHASFRLAERGWAFFEAKRAEWKAPPKDPLPPSLLRKPKSERMQEAKDKNQPIQTNSVQFDKHSTGDVKTQQYYYNPYTEPGDRVPVEPSRSPSRENSPRLAATRGEANTIEHPEEIGKLLSERIQTPPPKRRQRPVTLPGVGKENSDEPAHPNNNVAPVAVHGQGKQPFMLRQQQQQQPSFGAFSPNGTGAKSPRTTSMNANAGSTPMRAPRAQLINTNRTPQPIMHSSRKQPLSAQVRKRRMAGETLFSHSPQETSKALEVATRQGEPKRRRLLSVAPGNARKKQVKLPPVRRNNKREREEQILQEFNRKREKPAPVEPAKAAPATSTPTAPIVFGKGLSGVAAGGDPTAPIVFGKGLSGGGTGGDASAAPTGDQTTASTSTFVFGAGTATPVPAATQPSASAPADSKPSFVFGVGANGTAPGTTNAAATPSVDSKQGVSFGATPAQTTAAPPAATTTPGIVFGAKLADDSATNNTGTTAPAATTGDASKPFVFGAGAPSSSTPASSTPSTDVKPGIVFGGNTTSGTPAPVPTPGVVFGANNANTGTSTPAPSSGVAFGANTAAATPAPAAGFSFGGAIPATKPDPPAANTSDIGNAQPSFAFGSTPSNTPQPGATINTPTPSFAPTPNTQGGSSFLSPPIPAPHSTAGATPGFQAPPAAGAAPGGGGFGFGAGAAAPFASPAMPAMGGGAFAAGAPPSGGASARRRSRTRKGRR